jgi:hypothetical protein
MIRRGYTLVVTLSMVAFLTGTVTMLYISTRDSVLIAGNHRRHLVAKQAAQSGVSHFATLDYHYHDIEALPRCNRGWCEVLDWTALGAARYRVEARTLSEDIFEIRSIGEIVKKSRVIAASELLARYQTFYDER